ncbi:PTS lactose/cellobiose transporter subunit IIA [Gottschalkiaceae bacterium SANA]|nr:PTS lactose/cellobiose transporter subunit IIA [Gottschalkiaceae bacterium SANA]
MDMVDIEKLAEVSMEIISYAGMAKSKYILAYESLKKGNQHDYEKQRKEAEENYIHAHRVHSKVLTTEMETRTPQVSLLMVHAEDQLMSVETIRFLTTELAEMMQKLKQA